jgi:hypothetical protein
MKRQLASEAGSGPVVSAEGLGIDAIEGSIDISKLRRFLVKYFSESEVQNLCCDLEIDYENLVGKAKQDKVRSLILYAKRRQCLPDLIEAARLERPDIRWEQVFRPSQKHVDLAICVEPKRIA